MQKQDDDVNEVTEMWREIRHEKQNRHAEGKKRNLEVLAKSGLPYRLINNDECAVLREGNKPKVDFYPSSGRWKAVWFGKEPRYFEGGATAFLGWYKKQGV